MPDFIIHFFVQSTTILVSGLCELLIHITFKHYIVNRSTNLVPGPDQASHSKVLFKTL